VFRAAGFPRSACSNFIVFLEEDPDSGALHKSLPLHQFHAVNAAVQETVVAPAAMGPPARSFGRAGRADRRAGVVVAHARAAGKSFSMLFYAARIVR